METKFLPSISVVIPTLNAEKPLKECLKLIREQSYPQEKVEIIIADGSSTDKTIEVAKKYGAKIYQNPLKTAEAGKAVGVKVAKNELVALIDSDNYLPDKNWFSKMIKPFEDKEIIGAEPIEYTYRKSDALITRYSALLGMNDPICLFFGNYDRKCYLTGRWTDLKIKTEDKGDYLKVFLEKDKVPTIGANGTILRREFFKNFKDDYLFDIDEIYGLIVKGKNKFAKVKIGIIHVFSGDVKTFLRKQKRRIKDYTYYKKMGVRKYPWSKLNKWGLTKFTIYSILWLPTFLQACIGFVKKPDKAWFFHPLACWLTLWVYGTGKISQKLFGIKEINRDNWKQ